MYCTVSQFGTGSSSHYACGVYAHVNAIDSQKKYCDLVLSQMSEEQSRCGSISMYVVANREASRFRAFTLTTRQFFTPSTTAPSWGKTDESVTHSFVFNRNCVDVGVLAAFGKPTNSTDVSYYFARYVTAVDGFNNAPYYDSVLVDGRFRVACAIKTLKYLRRDSIFFMHDWPRSYRLIEKYADHLESHGTLAILAPKANLTAGADMEFETYRDSE